VPTAEQEARAFLAAQRQREAVRAAPPPAASPEAAEIQRDVSLPGPVGVLKGMLQPGNVIRTAGEIINPAIGGTAIQPLATGAQRAFDRFTGSPSPNSYVEDLAVDTVANEGANRVLGPVLGKVAGYIGDTAPVQAGRKYVAERLLGKITPDAKEAFDISGRMIDDLTAAVNRVRGGASPLYSRDAVEQRVAEVLPLLKKKGAFTVGDLTTGTPTDTLEGLTESSLRGRSRFGQKRQAADTAFEEWPKVYAAMLGDAAQGPDHLASMAAQEISRGVGRAIKGAGRKVGNVEKIVGKNVVDIDESLLAGIGDEISLYAKRMGGEGGAINLDPERIDQPLKAAIALVQNTTGKTFNMATGRFESPSIDMTPYAAYPPSAQEAIRTELEKQAGEGAKKTEFSFRDVRKLRSYLGQMEAKIPEAERRSAAASISSLSGALKERQIRVLDAEDAVRGNQPGTPRSLRSQWEAGNTLYKQAADLREGFKAKGWIQALEEKGAGSRVIKEIWPDDIDSVRLDSMKSLLGGDSSPYWKTLRRFKVEDMLGTHGKNPDYLLKELTSGTKHSADYWEGVLGKDDYGRLVDFAKASKFRKFGNPGKNRVIGSMVDAGMIMQGMDMPTALATGGMGPGKAARMTMRPVSWLVSTKKMAEWLTNPNDSAMFQALLKGSPIKRKKATTWFRNQVARAVADAAIDEDPVIRPLPAAVSKKDFGATTGRAPAAAGYAQ
jgi:hypothetical protein